MRSIKSLLRTKSILVAEDEPVTLEIMIKMLEFYFGNVRGALNGQEALRLLEQESIDVVLTDLTMPVMDGFELAKEIKAHYPQIPVLTLTAHKEEELIRRAKESGIREILHKPYSTPAFLQVMEKFFGKEI